MLKYAEFENDVKLLYKETSGKSLNFFHLQMKDIICVFVKSDGWVGVFRLAYLLACMYKLKHDVFVYWWIVHIRKPISYHTDYDDEYFLIRGQNR